MSGTRSDTCWCAADLNTTTYIHIVKPTNAGLHPRAASAMMLLEVRGRNVLREQQQQHPTLLCATCEHQRCMTPRMCSTQHCWLLPGAEGS
jgi:hypothetical protein